MRPRYFATSAALREWFAEHHATADELIVGFWKTATGKPSVTWPESIDEALCFGWIDGIRHKLDEMRYTVRFTPRRPGSTWSAVNARRAEALIVEGKMQPAGRAVFDARRENRSGIYSYEQRSVDLPEPYATTLCAHRQAREFLDGQPPSYRKAAWWFVVSAKKEETRQKRLQKLIACSARGERLPEFLRPARKPPV